MDISLILKLVSCSRPDSGARFSVPRLMKWSRVPYQLWYEVPTSDLISTSGYPAWKAPIALLGTNCEWLLTLGCNWRHRWCSGQNTLITPSLLQSICLCKSALIAPNILLVRCVVGKPGAGLPWFVGYIDSASFPFFFFFFSCDDVLAEKGLSYVTRLPCLAAKF